jgi:hypothetical protein
VYGAKAGRGRYDQIVAWYRQMRGRATELQTEAQRKVSEQADKMGRTTSGVSGTMPPPKDAPAG